MLHVVPGLGAGGMELAMARVVTGLTGNGMRHSVACLKGEAQIASRLPPETDIHCLHSRPNEPQLPTRLDRLIRRLRPTVIHARNWGAWPDMAAGRLMTRPIVPLVFSFHGLGEAGYMPLRRRLASRVLVRMTTCLFTVSEQSRRMLVAKWGWPEERVRVIPNGVDTGRFRPLGIPKDTGRTVVGTVGNLRLVKNHALLLRACAALTEEGIDLELRIAGDGPERANLLAAAESFGFADRLRLFGRTEDVPEFLNRLDVFALTSDSEQHPNALNEAMACGIPSVATRVGCVEELLDNGHCGPIVPPGDAECLVAALGRLIREPEQARQWAAAARERVQQHYSMSQMLEAYGRLYRDLSTGHERPT